MHCQGGGSTSSLIEIDVISWVEMGYDIHICAWGLDEGVVYLDVLQVSHWGHHLPHALSSPCEEGTSLPALDVGCPKMADMGGGEVLPEAIERYQKREGLGRGERPSGADER